MLIVAATRLDSWFSILQQTELHLPELYLKNELYPMTGTEKYWWNAAQSHCTRYMNLEHGKSSKEMKL